MGKNYSMISPGVETYEIDNSGLPDDGSKIGPVVVGRSERGPAFRPIKVKSMDEFIQIFGTPNAGGVSGDVWREGKCVGPAYGTYAAQAYLSKTSPLTFIRILGDENSNADAGGKAGWQTDNTTDETESNNGGAYGLFLIDSGSAQTGTLGAIFYLNEGSITLSGSYRNSSTEIDAAAALIGSKGANKEFTAVIRDSGGNIVKKTNFNFNTSSEKYIRKVFNTNPTVCNSDITATENLKTYWLGETFDRAVSDNVTASGAGLNFGFIAGLHSGSVEGSDFRFATQHPKTGWFIGQDLNIVTPGVANSFNPESCTKLFRIHTLQTGEKEQKDIKISIEDLKAPSRTQDPFGTFTITVRSTKDSDGAPKILERFTGLNMNPVSADFVAKRIGDMYTTWDYDNKIETEYGINPNISKYIRIEMNPSLEEASENPSLLPFGVFGPPVYKGFTVLSGATVDFTTQNDTGDTEEHVFLKAYNEIPRTFDTSPTIALACGANLAFEGCWIFPTIPLRATSADSSLSSNKQAYFGATTQKASSVQFDESYVDLVRCKPSGVDSYDYNGLNTKPSWVFTLDDISVSGGVATYASGSRAAGTSITALSGGYEAILDEGYNKFTSPLFGGFDGFDIKESEPLRNTLLSGKSVTSNYAYNSVRRALDLLSDSEYVSCNVITLPGITDESLTTYMINTAENRKDAIALFDVKGGYQPSTENSNVESSRLGSITEVVTSMKTRGDSSSYAACYYPWLKMKDAYSSKDIWIPPSVAMLGVYGNVEDSKEIWYAPAGNVLASLSNGASGLNISGVRERLYKKDRDLLYEYNINPIAMFPQKGISVWGQKTLEPNNTSALSRVNVRRMMNYIKMEVKNHAENILFEQNVNQTWHKFKSRVEPFLMTIKVRLGLTDYKLILDETTTTKEMIDRNSLYAKIYLQPARSIEKIYIDFVITNSGIEFTS